MTEGRDAPRCDLIVYLLAAVFTGLLAAVFAAVLEVLVVLAAVLLEAPPAILVTWPLTSCQPSFVLDHTWVIRYWPLTGVPKFVPFPVTRPIKTAPVPSGFDLTLIS